MQNNKKSRRFTENDKPKLMKNVCIRIQSHDHRLIVDARRFVNIAEVPYSLRRVWCSSSAFFTTVCLWMEDATALLVVAMVYQLRQENPVDDVDDAVGCEIIWTSHQWTLMRLRWPGLVQLYRPKLAFFEP